MDNKPLTFTVAKVSNLWFPRQRRYLTYTLEFTTDVRHLAGKSKTVADALSRAEIFTISSSHPRVDYRAMALAQRADESITSIRTASTDLVIYDIPVDNNDVTIC